MRRIFGMAFLVVGLPVWAGSPTSAASVLTDDRDLSIKIGAASAVRVPRDNWQLLGETRPSAVGHGFDWRMLSGPRWITVGREEVGMLGLSSDRATAATFAFSRTGAYVFAKYSPGDAQLRVFLNKVERSPEGTVRSYIADFTPAHGDRWAAARAYLTNAEAKDRTRPGRNPFAAFRGAGRDPIFYQVSWPAVQVIVGHAMRYQRATAAITAVAESRFDVQTEESGNFFRKTVTTRVNGYAKPHWWVALPVDVQPAGVGAQICVVSVPSGCDAPEHVAASGVSFADWSGGNMSSTEDLLYRWETSESSFTVLAFTVLTAAMVFVAVGELAVIAGESASATTTAVGVAFGGQGTLMMSPLTAASFAGGTYAVASTQLQGGGSVVAPQDRYLGPIGDGRLAPSVPAGEQATALQRELRKAQIGSAWDAGLSASAQVFGGTCPRHQTVTWCRAQGFSAGAVHRPDRVDEVNDIREMRLRYDRCVAVGATGHDLSRCMREVSQ